jgi:hypothetical protein
MNLLEPGVGTEPGPQYALDINTSLTLIDGHDHSPGRGVLITPAGLDINTALPFNNNPATLLSYLSLQAGSSPSTALQSISVAPAATINELYYTDSNGVSTQITKNGSVNATASSIPGESYAAGTFIWTQTQSSLPTTPANFDIGSIIIRPNTAATTNGVQLIPSSSVSSQYALTLPLIPAATSFLTVTGTGAGSGVISGSVPTVGGITSSNIANNTITYSNLSLLTNSSLLSTAASITNTYTAAIGDGMLFCSGTSFTVSLYTAIGNTGAKLLVSKADSSLLNVITVAAHGGQSIMYGSVAYSSVTLNTPSENWLFVSDGANWQVIEHSAKTSPVAITGYAATAFGTLAYSNTYSWRDGRYLYMQGTFQAGTVGATQANVTIGFNGTVGNVAIDSTLISATGAVPIGVWGTTNTSNGVSGMLFTNTNGSQILAYFGGTILEPGSINPSASLVTITANGMGGNGNIVGFNLKVPIDGWFD